MQENAANLLETNFRKIINYLMVLLLGLFCTYLGFISLKNRWGASIYVLMLIILYTKKKLVALFISFHVVFLQNFVYNPVYQRANIFILKHITLPESWISSKLFTTISQVNSLFLFFVVFFSILVKKNKINKLSQKLLIVVVLSSLIMMSGSFLGLHAINDTVNAILSYNLLFIVIILIQIEFTREEVIRLFPYLLFCISIFQILLFIIFWIPSFIFNAAILSGDWILGTASTNTNFLYLIGIAFIVYYFNMTNRLRNIVIFLFLLLLIFLPQAGTQTFLFFLSIVIVQVLFAFMNRTTLLRSFTLLLLSIVVTITMFFFISHIFPYLGRHLNYAVDSIEMIHNEGLFNNPKILGIIRIIQDYEKFGPASALLGIGSGEFFKIQDSLFFLKVGDPLLTMRNAVYSPINILFYDFGILSGIIYLFGYFTIYQHIKSIYNKNKSNVIISCFTILLYILFSHFFLPITSMIIVSIMAGAFIGSIIKISTN